MDDGKKKIWICLLVIVLAALAAGILYYLCVPDAPDSEGFLIRATYSICAPEGDSCEV